MKTPALLYVERAISEIGAEPGDFLVNDPIHGLSIIRRIAGKRHIPSAYRAHLCNIPLRPPEPAAQQQPLLFTTPPVDGWQ